MLFVLIYCHVYIKLKWEVKRKKKKPEGGANELSCIFKEKIIYVRINES